MYETEFDNIFYGDAINPIIPEKYDRGWPFINDQAVLVPTEFNVYGDPKAHVVQQGLEIVEIFFKSPILDMVTRDVRTSLVDKISMIGGMLGLFTGFSVISGIEIMYFIIRVFLKIYQSQRRNEEQQQKRECC